MKDKSGEKIRKERGKFSKRYERERERKKEMSKLKRNHLFSNPENLRFFSVNA